MPRMLFWFLRILKILTFRRILNLIQIEISYRLGLIFKNLQPWGKPISISIEPTTSCNLQCPECPSGLRAFSRPTGQIEMATLHKIIEQLHRQLMYVTFYFQGEPLLLKAFPEMVKFIKKHRILVATSTNGHFLNAEMAMQLVESGLDRLIISLDGTDEATYTQYRRNGEFDRVIQNIKTMVETKRQAKSSSPWIELQFIVFGHNEHQIDEIKSLARSLQVDQLSLKTAQIYSFEQGSPLIPSKQEFSRYAKNEEGNYQIKSKLPNHCHRSWNTAVVTWDGDWVPCCFDKDAQYRFGNLHKDTVAQIKNKEPYRNFLTQIRRDRKQIDICRNCTEGMR